MKRRNTVRRLLAFAAPLALGCAALLCAGDGSNTPAAAGASPAPPAPVEVTAAARVRTSTVPVRSFLPVAELSGGREIKRIRLNPNVLVNLAPPAPDPALQSTTTFPARQTPPVVNVDGVSQGFKRRPQDPGHVVRTMPPDTVGAVGTTQYVQWVNTAFVVFNKATGAAEFGPFPGRLLFTELGGKCATNNDGDPIVQFDKMAQRWVLAQFSVDNGASSGFSQCVAVSTTADAGGTYHLYEFTYQFFDDYPKMGVWPDGYYTTFTMFDNQNRSIGGRVCAYEREKMLRGQPARQQCFQLSRLFFGLLPSDLDGATSALVNAAGAPRGPAAPPPGSPNYVVNLGNDGRTLNFWRFHVDWVNTANTTFGVGAANAPNAVIPVKPFRFSCNGAGTTCAPQPGTPNKLDTLGERLMYRLAYRRFSRPDGSLDHESLLLNHSVDVGLQAPQTAVRWYELRDPSAPTPTVFQQGSYAPDPTTHRWFGSIAMDKRGGIALGYSVTSNTVRPGVRYTGRAAGDPLNKLGPETTLIAGTGSQRCRRPNGSCDPSCLNDDGSCADERYGDYSSLTVDPSDDCTFWFTTEYLAATGSFNWHTRIGSFKLSGCP
ncbi:MAG: hypothetical protein QOG71_3872 [Pyrinomonadaceae bacterium]|nr:hypothetical protein [Pyrinomonadaceae bacterium]